MTLAPDFASALADRFDPPEREDAELEWETPGELAAAVDRSVVQTPALALIDDAVVWAYSTRGARLAISIAPQEGKSSRVTKAGSLWALIRDRELRIGIASYAQSLADGFGRDIRNWINSFNGDDGSLDLGLRVAADYGSARRWQLAGHRGGVVCVGVGSGLTGRPLDALVVDDPFAGREQADSEYFRERVWGWWQSVAAPRLAPGAPVLVICTRWHEDDLVGRLTAAEDGHRWRVINIPALADHDPEKGQSDPLGRQPGEWMESARRRTDADWEQIRIQSGSRNFGALYQGRPSPDQGNVWLRHWWRRYHEPLWSQHPVIPGAYLVNGCDEVVLSWDMAFKDTKGSDYVAGGVWARRGADVFLLDQVRKRLSFTDTVTAFAALAARWPQATRKLVEDKANGPAVISLLKSKVPGIVAVTPKDSKYARASAVAPFIEAGNAFLPAAEVALFDVEEFINECVIGSTMILTRLGLKRADEIEIGDEVLTHLGRFRRVTAISSRTASELVEIRAKTLDPIRLTPSHPVYAMHVRRNKGGFAAPDGKGWVDAGEVSCRQTFVSPRGQIEPSHKPHHAMTFPVLSPDQETAEIDLRAWFDASVPEPKTEGKGRRTWAVTDDGQTIGLNVGRAARLRYRQPLDRRFGRICGLYLAEGSYSVGRAFWSFHKDETRFVAEVQSFLSGRFGVGSHLNAHVGPNAVNVTVSLPRLSAFFATFGSRAPEKRIPWWAWEAPAEFVEGLISGWLDGDGCAVSNGWRGATTSPHLAWGIRALATRLGFWALIYRTNARGPSLIRGRPIVSRRDQYTVSLLDEEKVTHVFDGEHVGLWVKQSARLPGATVYNFDVEEDRSYVTTGGAVHNCASFPNAANDDQVDQASQALAEMLLDGSGAAAWIEWARRKAEEAAAANSAVPVRASPGFTPEQVVKARVLIVTGGLTPAGDGRWHARSGDDSAAYLVSADSCECPAGQHDRLCYHIAAVRMAEPSATEAQPAAAPQPALMPTPGITRELRAPDPPPAPADPAEARKLARDAAFREQQSGWRLADG